MHTYLFPKIILNLLITIIDFIYLLNYILVIHKEVLKY
jgi:hypothetical protein